MLYLALKDVTSVAILVYNNQIMIIDAETKITSKHWSKDSKHTEKFVFSLVVWRYRFIMVNNNVYPDKEIYDQPTNNFG